MIEANMFTDEQFFGAPEETFEQKVFWQMGLSFGEENFVVTWSRAKSLVYGNSGFYLKAWRLNNNGSLEELEELEFGDSEDSTPHSLYKTVLEAAKSFAGTKALTKYPRDFFGISKDQVIGLNNEPITSNHDVVYDLFLRSEQKEYIGQTNEFLYVQDIRRILSYSMEFGYSMEYVYEIIDGLKAQKKIGLNGNILVPWERSEADRLYLEKETGHKDYDSSDMGGYWYCRYCGEQGDWQDPDRANPKQVPCIPPLIS